MHRYALFAPGLALLLVAGHGAYARQLPAPACNPADALEIHVQADARDNGYRFDESDMSSLFRLATYDLVQGRISFFEVQVSAGRYARYALSDSHNPSCIARHLFDAQLAGLPIPARACVSETQVSAPASRFRVESDSDSASLAPASVSVREQQTGKLLARYQRPGKIRRWLAGLFGGDSCDTDTSRTQLPLWMATGFVFTDRWGNTLRPNDLVSIQAERAANPGSDELMPPLGWVRRRLATEGRLGQESCTLPGWMGDTEVHVLELAQGPLEIEARLDALSNKAGVVLVDVHAPDKAVVLLVRAKGPTVWHIHESSSSSIVAVLVRGHHGQAVVGLTAFSRILMSTQLHNPFTNCTEEELAGIESRLTQQYGIARIQRQDLQQSPQAVRYGVGEPMRDGAELFHHYRSMADFEVRPSP